MIKLIVFDWDDVFTLGSKDGYFRCYHETLVDLEVHLDPEVEKKRILAKWSQPHREELRELLKENPELLDEACDIYEKKLFGGVFVDSLRFVEGGIDLLIRLNKKYKLAIATGVNPKLLREEIFTKFKVPDVFSQIISTYDIDSPNNHKPHPFMLEEIMRAQKALPKETILVGDAKTDVQMAQAAAVTPIVVLTGHLNEKEAEALGVKHVVRDVTLIEPVLGKLSS